MVEERFRLVYNPNDKGKNSLSILFGEKPVCILLYEMKGEMAEINDVKNIFGNEELVAKFKAQVNVFPFEYLFDELVRRGAKKFISHGHTTKGLRMVNAFLKRRQIIQDTSRPRPWHEFNLTQRAQANALRRKRIP